MFFIAVMSIFLLNVLNFNIVNSLNHEVSPSPSNYNLSYHISVQRYNTHSCSGIIINEKFILTAGHCVVDFYTGKIYDKKTFSILAGTQNLKSNDTIRILIDRIIPHPKHSFHHYNVAVLQLKSKLNFSNTIQSIQFYRDSVKNIPIGTEIQISGWRCSNIYQPLLDNLQIDKLVLIANDECSEEEDGFSEIFCLTHKRDLDNKNDEICIGDTGGPAIFNNQLIGIASFVGFECKNDDCNGFTNINFIQKWINKIIN